MSFQHRNPENFLLHTHLRTPLHPFSYLNPSHTSCGIYLTAPTTRTFSYDSYVYLSDIFRTNRVSSHFTPDLYSIVLHRYPWMIQTFHTYFSCESQEYYLSKEIFDYTSFMSPTLSEYLLRRHIIDRTSAFVKENWPSAKVHLYGSSCTGLDLPQADIDLTILGIAHGIGSFHYCLPRAADISPYSFVQHLLELHSANAPNLRSLTHSVQPISLHQTHSLLSLLTTAEVVLSSSSSSSTSDPHTGPQASLEMSREQMIKCLSQMNEIQERLYF